MSVSMKATHDKYQLLPDSANLTVYCIDSDCLHTKFTESATPDKLPET